MCFKAGAIFITAEGTVVAQSANNAVIAPISTQPIKRKQKKKKGNLGQIRRFLSSQKERQKKERLLSD